MVNLSFPHFLLLSLLSLISATEFSYSQHCSLIFPESAPKQAASNLLFPLSQFHTGYGGGQGIFTQNSSSFSKSFVFRTRNSYYNHTRGLLKVEADFIFPAPYILNQGMGKSLIRLSLVGFWSESSGKLCMIGSSTSKNYFEAVLKLQNVRNSSNVSSLINGTLECLNSSIGSNCFQPISILMLPQMNYEYSLIPEQIQPAKNSTFLASSMPGPSFCNEGWWPPSGFDLKYEETSCVSANRCSPFGDVMPPALFITGFGCSDKEQRLRILVEFYKTSSTDFYLPFYPNTTLVGEGYWDEKKLSVVACRFMNIAAAESSRLAGCSIRLSLTFSDTLSIRETGNLVGKIWSKKTAKDPGYFDSIMFYTSENRIVGVPGLKYKYTETDRVKSLCKETQSLEHKRARFPDGNSISMRFEMYASSSKGKVAWGYASPFSVGDKFYVNSAVEAKYRTLVNMSYKVELSMLRNVKLGEGIFLPNRSSIVNRVEISAEGIYNENSGSLCMVGCRKLDHSLDCEILLKFQFSPSGNVKGRIESIREKSDPLYFDPLETSSLAAYSIIETKNIIWRMDKEMVFGVISCTFACVFVGLQCLHGKKQPEVVPLVSTFMLSILALGNFLPLGANLGSLLLNNGDRKHQFLGIGEVNNELMLCLLEMVVFFFQFNLLQLTWIARSRDERSKRLWICEKNSLIVCVPIYGAMGLLGWLVKGGEGGELSSSCREVVLNGFLVPQILVNILRDSKENVVSCYFYMGTTFINLLPHVYNVYEAYPVSFPVWEIVVISEGVVFAAITYWQQRYGGNFIIWH